MKRLLCMFVVFLASACAPGSETTPRAAASPTEPSPSPSASARLACTMPYVTTDPNQWGEYVAVGFLKLPNDVFQADSTATAPLPPSPAQPMHFPGYGSHPWGDPNPKRGLPVAPS